MNEITQITVEKVNHFALEFLKNNLSENYLFHTVDHTLDVLKNVETIGRYSNLGELEMNMMRISALFHDVGYTKIYNGHEEQSVIIAEKYLKNEGFEDIIIHEITSTILATKIPQNPKNKLSEILCDADLMHLTYDNFFERIELMRQEWELLGIASMSTNEIYLNSVKFFNAHHYHSEYGIKFLEEKKEKILKRIIEKISLKIG